MKNFLLLTIIVFSILVLIMGGAPKDQSTFFYLGYYGLPVLLSVSISWMFFYFKDKLK